MFNFFHNIISGIGVAIISVGMFFSGASSTTPNNVATSSLPLIATSSQTRIVASTTQVVVPKKEITQPKQTVPSTPTPKLYVPPAVSNDTTPKQQAENPAVVPVQKNGYQVCGETNATWDGTSYTSSGSFNCTCKTGYTSSSDGKSCVVTPIKTGYQVCGEEYINATWDGTYLSSGQFNCVCRTGYTLNGDSCQLSQQSSQQPVQNNNQTQINALLQQILDIKTQYYKQVAGAQSSGTSVVAQGEVNRLTDEANQKIAQINLQIQQLQLNNQ